MCYVWRVMWYGPAPCLSGNKKCFRCRIVVTSSVTNMGVKLFIPQQKENLSQKMDIACVLWNITCKRAHDQQSRHVAGHDVNYLPEEKENDYCAVTPPCHSDTSRRWENSLHILWWWKVCGSFIACICAANCSEQREQRGNECLENTFMQ